MLPDFPVQKELIALQISKAVEAKMKSDQLMSMVHIHQMNEGSAMDVHSGVWKDHIEMNEVGYQAEVSLEDLIHEGPKIYLKQALQAAEEFIKAQHKMLLSKADEVTKKTGMSFDAKGKAFSAEMLMQALERMELSFTETGQPKLPTLVMHPQLAAYVKKKMQEWEKDEDFKRRWYELIERKRKEWFDRENSRKLVD